MEYEIKLPYLISDGMVLQRDKEIKIWGEASPAQKLDLTFCGERFTTKVMEDGKWEIHLHDLRVGGPYEMLIACDGKQKVVKDIYVGDVWLLGGQSNMEIPISRTLDLFEDEVKDAACEGIRQFYVPHVYDFHGPSQEESGGAWVGVSPETIYDFSAVGYFFAKNLYEKYQIPIGLLFAAVGGTPAQAWMSENTLEQFPEYMDILRPCKENAYVTEVKQSEEQQTTSWYQQLDAGDKGIQKEDTPWYSEDMNDADWKEIDLPRSFQGTELEEIRGSVWFRKEFTIPEDAFAEKAKLKLGTLIDGDETYINGVMVGNTAYKYPPRRYGIPDGLLKPGKNIIAVRLILTQSMGAFIPDMPYYLYVGSSQIPLSGTWKYRIGISMEGLPFTTFFEYKPAGLYNGMIYPLRKYSICGALWYQGESNTEEHPDNYKQLMTALIKDWRDLWKCEDLPFFYVQLANFCLWRLEPEESNWAILREQQRKLMEIPYTGMAVIYDVGQYNELHPQDKKTVGNRLALWARNKVYGEALVCSGPIYHHKEIEGKQIRLCFTETGSGLMVKGEALKTFLICGKDRRYVAAEAKIEGDTVVVSAGTIEDPMDVRYAWSENPEEANLYNKEGLPASPFTTEA